MTDAFTPCPGRNRDGIPCWLVAGHRSVCEVHPSDRKRTEQPVWSRFLAGEPFYKDAMTQWREEKGYDPITGESA